MSNFADFTKLTFVNGTSPAISATNLNKNENYLDDIGNELNYSKGFNLIPLLNQGYQKNIKLMEDFKSISGWTTSSAGDFGTTKESNSPINPNNLQIKDDDNSSSIMYIYRTDTAVDLSTFNDGSTSDVDDYINISYYVQDSTYISAIGLRLGTDSSNYYSTSITVSTGWNLATIKKSSFSSTGSPSWSSIPYLYITVTSTNNALGKFVWFSDIRLVRDDGFYMNPFLYDNGSGAITSEPYIVAYTDSLITYDQRVGKLGWTLTDVSSTASCVLLDDVNSFSIKMEAYSKHSDDGPAVRWYIDSSNYFIVSVENNYLYLKETVSGSTTTVASKALSTIDFYDRMELYIDKVDNVIRASLLVDGQQPVHLDISTSFSSTVGGSLSLVIDGSAQFYMITDLVVGHSMADTSQFMKQNLSIIKKKMDASYRTLSTAYTADDELIMKLPANGIFEITVHVVVQCANSTPNFKMYIGSTGIISSGFRHTNGASLNGVAANNADYMMTEGRNITAGTAYGVWGSGGWSSIKETIFVQTGNDGGEVSVNWGQYVSYITFLYLEDGSSIIARRIG